MKIAYLILAHNQPGHLFRMIEALNSEHTSFYVHIDKKSEISNFNPTKYPGNVLFLQNRRIITHGGFSILQATLDLLSEGLKECQNDYFIFLSGWDYPIRNCSNVFSFLQDSYPTNYLSFYPLVGKADHIVDIQKYYFMDFIGKFPKFIRIPLRGIKWLVQRFPVNRKFLPGMIPYRGSSSFCLSRPSIEYIFSFLNTDIGKSYFNYFKSVYCADEIFIHTIVLNSPFASQCRFYERDVINSKSPMRNENKAYLHYIDWNPERENPAILTMQDYFLLKSSEALFARKFNEVKSKQLLDAIDVMIKE